MVGIRRIGLFAFRPNGLLVLPGKFGTSIPTITIERFKNTSFLGEVVTAYQCLKWAARSEGLSWWQAIQKLGVFPFPVGYGAMQKGAVLLARKF